MKRFLTLLVAFIFLLPASGVLAQRQTIELPDGWRFLKADAALDAPVNGPGWESVTVPHCYNALDGQNGKAADPGVPGGYYRGPTWYQRTLDVPAAWKDQRVFIRFGAVFLVADVFLNGEKIGEHRGGFAAFCYELTDKLKFGASNELRVRVDNAKNPDVAPLSADFTMEGGIYRPVQLIVTDKTCITPLDYAGPGVYVTPTNVSANGADIEIETSVMDGLARAGDTHDHFRLQTSIRDAHGEQVTQKPSAETASPTTARELQMSGGGKVGGEGTIFVGGIPTTVNQRFHLDHPHLWNGVKDPYTYTVNVKVIRDGKTVDSVTVPLGFRTVAVDNDRGFLLNGQPYPVHGVNRHQEKRDKGWALSDADHDLDFQIIREIGATAVRLAHYQQAQHVLDLCDHDGLLVWQEIPLVNEIGGSEAFAENAKQQLTEMIRQCSNHPSIVTWSTCNELYNNKTPPVEPLIHSLDDLARALDPSRTPALASDHPDRKELNRIAAWIGFNLYPGWYASNPENFTHDVQHAWEQTGGDKRIAITEYGAGANPAQHQEGPLTQPKPGGPWHPEEWQSHLHARIWDQARNNPHLWGTFLWAMFDFAVDSRNEGETPGINDKGMVTEDRKTRKDAFYFYKANWTSEPMVYLTSRRAVKRTQSQAQVKAYTNLPEAELILNGKSLGTLMPSDIHVLLWKDVALQLGRNVVEVAARGLDGKTIHDQCEWTLEKPPSAPSPAASTIPTTAPVP